MGTKTVEKFLSLADDNFVHDVNDDLKLFISEGRANSVLVFPPVSNYRRFLIHQSVERLGLAELATFSIGGGDGRRTVVCYKHNLLSDEACAQPAMGLTPTERHDATISSTTAAVGVCKAARAQEKIRSSSLKPRRPDRAVYVPRALRAADNEPARTPPQERRASHSADSPKCPKSPAPRDKSAGTPRKSIDKTFCNVYTPPHLRSHRANTAPSIDPPDGGEPATEPCLVQDDTAYCDQTENGLMDVQVGENFYIGDYFNNGQLGLYAPPYYGEYADGGVEPWAADEARDAMAGPQRECDVIDGRYHYHKDEDVEKNELKRASQEINRSSKRIIKQSFDSDVLVISDPVERREGPDIEPSPPDTHHNAIKEVKPKPKLEAKVSLKREENDWEAVFDESGECLDPSLLEELTATVGRVHISTARHSYEQYQTRSQALLGAPLDEAFAHVVEVYDFPSEFKTNDLLALFSEYKDTGFEIKWVDDTHALIVFSSAKIAAEVLSTQRSLARCRPLHAATLESRNKAKKCAEFLQPYRQRPETCTALARRLVSGALGVRLSTAQQERAEERRLITLAREKKRQAALHKEAAWDGSLANQSVSET